MQVRSGDSTGRPDFSYLSASHQSLALFNIDFVKVAIHRHEALAVIDDHGVAIKIIVSRRRHGAIDR